MLHESVLAPIFDGMAKDFIADVYSFIWPYIKPVLVGAFVMFSMRWFLVYLFKNSGCGDRESRKNAGIICDCIDLKNNLKGWVKK